MSNSIAIVSNGVDLAGNTTQASEASRTIFFFGRIDPKKGVGELLHAWQLVAGAPSAADWHLQITGWGEPSYVEATQRLAGEFGVETSVAFTGPHFSEAKAQSFRGAAAFILPSFSEGIPMAVLEAWSQRLSALMTRECDFPEGYAAGAGLRIEPEPTKLAASLTTFIALSADEHRAMGGAGCRLVEAHFTWDRVAAEMHTVYTWVLGGGSPPACVVTD